ncbi:DNA polymerase-3 subunit epsilon [Andreprevotia lacus DSM 23236]|jgi:DNA polymerase-3 subunit epsilon|uniref:DNA polymerase-3 subunit epsilon n=1 Tax=Andreprevotia lacus DSM 23236 TaxID=1121001 RepID=A0A1W1XQE8_9NEIS|nr:3'-5' exonuclease [Andreprevotia lacus]SMC26199.1 DNA polymerase-3 subunit epsilon [Andreprevotia lacus DSM 23236]
MWTALLERWRLRRLQRKLRNPAYAHLLAPYAGDEAVCIDCETSSLDPSRAEILSIAAVRIKGNRLCVSDHLLLTVRPQRRIDPATVPIHGLREQDVADGLPVADALAKLLAYIGNRPLVGYYLEFDVAIINRHLRPLIGIGLPNRRIEVSALYYDRHVSAYRPEVDLSLDAISHTLQLPALPRHDPLCDALMAGLIYLKLQTRTPNP